jgi:hypothetical protein
MAAREYARLALEKPLTLQDGTQAKDLVILRATARDMVETFDQPKWSLQLARFIQLCGRAEVGSNGTGQLHEIASLELNMSDASEMSAILGAMIEEGRKIELPPDADGVTEPLVYTLQFPISFPKGDGETETISQIEFCARKLGDLSEFLDSRGRAEEFATFMRLFGTLLGTKYPMNEAVINALDFVDYFVIRDKILGKLATPRGRWKKVSISPP